MGSHQSIKEGRHVYLRNTLLLYMYKARQRGKESGWYVINIIINIKNIPEHVNEILIGHSWLFSTHHRTKLCHSVTF